MAKQLHVADSVCSFTDLPDELQTLIFSMVFDCDNNALCFKNQLPELRLVCRSFNKGYCMYRRTISIPCVFYFSDNDRRSIIDLTAADVVRALESRESKSLAVYFRYHCRSTCSSSHDTIMPWVLSGDSLAVAWNAHVVLLGISNYSTNEAPPPVVALWQSIILQPSLRSLYFNLHPKKRPPLSTMCLYPPVPLYIIVRFITQVASRLEALTIFGLHTPRIIVLPLLPHVRSFITDMQGIDSNIAQFFPTLVDFQQRQTDVHSVPNLPPTVTSVFTNTIENKLPPSVTSLAVRNVDAQLMPADFPSLKTLSIFRFDNGLLSRLPLNQIEIFRFEEIADSVYIRQALQTCSVVLPSVHTVIFRHLILRRAVDMSHYFSAVTTLVLEAVVVTTVADRDWREQPMSHCGFALAQMMPFLMHWCVLQTVYIGSVRLNTTPAWIATRTDMQLILGALRGAIPRLNVVELVPKCPCLAPCQHVASCQREWP